jgi:pimeloyl-ACP methyl ester carboxylesterase
MWTTEVIAGAVLRRAGKARGPALWLVHGFGESSLSFVPLFATNLPSTFELLAPDWPGAGLTPAVSVYRRRPCTGVI